MACFLTAITAFGVAPITSGVGVFGDNYAGSSLSVSPLNSSEKAIHDAAILSGGDLGLDPENDPVVWVTDNGFEIKSHDVAVSSGTTTVSSVSYKYVTLGSWNWIIIGYSTKEGTPSSGISGYVNVGGPTYNDYANVTNNNNIRNQLVPESTSPAGKTIYNELALGCKDQYYSSSAVTATTTKLKEIFTNAKADPQNEIPANCVLCLCAGTTGTTSYNNTGGNSYFPNSNLDSAMTTVYNNIKTAAGNAIQSVSLTTYGSNSTGTMTLYTHSEYLFPLATSNRDTSQTFCVETYLDTAAKRDIDATWWLRSGMHAYSSILYIVSDTGSVGAGTMDRYLVSASHGVRPAFVLKLA